MTEGSDIGYAMVCDTDLLRKRRKISRNDTPYSANGILRGVFCGLLRAAP